MSFDELIKNDYDLIYWHKKEVISYHLIYHLCKFVGFDILTFTPLNDAIFEPRKERNETKFFRFHFRALPFRKMSSHVWDIMLIDEKFETRYNSVFQSKDPRVSEAFFQGMIDSFVDLVNLKDEYGNLVEINHDTIFAALKERLGGGGHEAYGQWQKQESLDNSIKTLNQWRVILKEHKYEQFLKTCFEKAYKNHFKRIKGLKLNIALATQEDVDLLNKIYKNTKFKFKLDDINLC